jgi:hypothetical protein
MCVEAEEAVGPEPPSLPAKLIPHIIVEVRQLFKYSLKVQRS